MSAKLRGRPKVGDERGQVLGNRGLLKGLKPVLSLFRRKPMLYSIKYTRAHGLPRPYIFCRILNTQYLFLAHPVRAEKLLAADLAARSMVVGKRGSWSPLKFLIVVQYMGCVWTCDHGPLRQASRPRPKKDRGEISHGVCPCNINAHLV